MNAAPGTSRKPGRVAKPPSQCQRCATLEMASQQHLAKHGVPHVRIFYNEIIHFLEHST